MKIKCAHCGKVREMFAGHVNRARAGGYRLFCGRRCAGIARRQHKTKSQMVEEKRLYDQEYRAKNLARITERKREYFERTYDPVKAAADRKKTMPRHVKYCRQPAYRVKKSAYDRKRRAADYGEFAEAFQLTIDLNREIKGRMTNEEIKWENRTANKAQFRKRSSNPEKERSRPRFRGRRDRHQAAHG